MSNPAQDQSPSSGDNKEILPSFWSDDFLTLLPGESRDITWGSIEETPTQEPFRVEIEGWNVAVCHLERLWGRLKSTK